MQQAAYLYSAKLTPSKSNAAQRRPASAKMMTSGGGMLIWGCHDNRFIFCKRRDSCR